MFLAAEGLPWSDSADASAASLFAGFVGTMPSSDFSPAFIPALPPVEFSDRCRSEPFVGFARQAGEISRFSHLECLRHARVYDSAASSSCSPVAHDLVLPSPCLNRIGTRLGTARFNDYWGAQWLACTDLHIGRSERMCHHKRPSEEGRSRRLIVLRKTLSFSIPSRFIPALADAGSGIHLFSNPESRV